MLIIQNHEQRIINTTKRLVAAVALILMICCGLPQALGDERLPADPLTKDEKIRKLVKQLDDPSFSKRESASTALGNIGTPALRTLALNGLASSPESAWRTKKTLELIGTRGDEDAFYKSVGILRLLYSDSLDESERLSQRILQLQHQWKEEQKKNVLARMTELGAIVNQANQQDIPGPMFFNQRIVINGRVQDLGGLRKESVEELQDNPGKSKAAKPASRVQRAQLTTDETTKEVDKILLASLEENRELVMNDLESKNLPDETSRNAEEMNQRLVMLAMQRRINGLDGANPATGIGISFTDSWKGSTADLDELKKLDTLTQIELGDAALGRDELSALAEIGSVAKLRIVGDVVSDDVLRELGTLSNLRELEIVGRNVKSDTMQAFSDVRTLTSLTLRDCELEEDCLKKLSRTPNLRSVFLSEMQVPGGVFDSLANLHSVNYVNLSVCKFQTTAYQTLKQARPNLQTTFTAQAFLGVRGPQTYPPPKGEMSCIISEIIAGSGAEKGGMQVGDLIEKVNGQPINKFEDLRLHIAQHKAGETVKFSVRRGGELVHLNITLTKFDNGLE